MLLFTINAFKWLFHFVLKAFFVFITALLFLLAGTFILGIDVNAIYQNITAQKLIESFFQHVPHIGMLLESIIQFINSASNTLIDLSLFESAIYPEVLFCCIYLAVVGSFSATIQFVTKLLKPFMHLGKVSLFFADLFSNLFSYILAIGVADLLHTGIIRHIPANIACWILAAVVIIIPLTLSLLRKEGLLNAFLKLICACVLDILQLVLIYFSTLCISILGNPTLSENLPVPMHILIYCLLGAAVGLLTVSTVRRLVTSLKKK